MPSSLVDLRPDRRLLDHEFEGYKLNLQALPHFSHELSSHVDRVFPDDIQYSFIHAKLFALHNHLVPDKWDYTHSFYYIDEKQQVRHISFDSTTQSFQNTVVYDVPAHVERKPGHFNLCLSFPSNTLAVVGDGTGYLHIVDTQARNRPSACNAMWQTLQSSLILGEEKYFVIVDSRIIDKDGAEVLHCLLQSVEQNDNHFYSVLSWVTFKFDENSSSWCQMSFREIQGKGIVHYAALETLGSAVYIASDYPFKFTKDSEKEIVEKKEVVKTILYTWLQTMEDITVTIKLEENFDKKLLRVDVGPLEVKLSYAGKDFVNGKLRNRVDSELTTWNVQDNGQVNVLLTKSDSMLWDDLIEGGDKNGEQIMDESLIEEAHRRLAHLCSETEAPAGEQAPGLATQELEECDAASEEDTVLGGDKNGEQIMDESLIEEAHRRLAHLCSETEAPAGEQAPGLATQELEECDAASEEDTVLVRLDTDHATTHRVPLSVHRYLFSISIDPQRSPAIALRHDVDACIWQPYPNTFLIHEGTLNAFGYIQSSKTNRKFITCPPNLSYGVVCESSRHIFVYQHRGSGGQLRQRAGGVSRTVKIGQQNVFNVEQYGEVVGVEATNDYLFVLTESTLVAIGVQ